MPVATPQSRDLATLDRRFHLAAAVAAAVITVVGFSPTFFTRPATLPALPWLVTVHGVVFSGWLVAYALQSALITVKRRDLHRTLGYWFVGLGAAMVLLGMVTAVEAVRRGAGGAFDDDPRVFMVLPFFDFVLFAGFLGAGYWWRRSLETHKRLMLLATIDLVGPAMARIAQHSSRPVFSEHFPMWAFAGMMLCIAVASVYDLATRRRIHPAYLWGALTFIASGPIRFAIGGTAAWLSFVDWMLRWL
jgi:uncharacterized membrane protein